MMGVPSNDDKRTISQNRHVDPLTVQTPTAPDSRAGRLSPACAGDIMSRGQYPDSLHNAGLAGNEKWGNIGRQSKRYG